MKWLYVSLLSLLTFQTDFQEKIASYKQADNLEEYIYTYLDYTATLKTTQATTLEQCNKQIWRKAKNKNEQLARVYFWANYAYYLKKENQLQEATKAYEKAWNIFNTNKLKRFEIYDSCLKPLANCYTRLGDYEKAIYTHKIILETAQHTNDEALITGTLINIAIIYYDLGRHEDAIALLMQAKNDIKLSANHHFLIYSKLAKNHIALKQWQKAKQFLEAANPTTDYELAMFYKIKATITTHKEAYIKTVLLLQKSIKYIKKSNASKREIAKTQVLLANTLEKLNQDTKALNMCQKALLTLSNKAYISKVDLYAENTFKEIFDCKALLYEKQKNYTKACEELDLAFYVDNLLRNTFNFQESKLFLQNETRKRSEKAIEIALKDNNIKQAFNYANQSKSIILSTEYQFNSRKNNYQNDSLIRLEKKLKKQIAKLKNSKQKEDLITMNSSTEQLAIIREKIVKKYHFLEDKNISLEAIQKQLQIENSTLLVFFEGIKNTYIFTVNAEKITVNRFNIAEIVYDFIELFKDYSKLENNFEKYKKLGFEIYQKLELNKLKNNKLIIIPDGIFSAFPFDALLTAQSRNNTFKALPYLIKKHQISYAYATDLYFSSPDTNTKKLKLLGLFPVFENSNSYLKYAKEELKDIQKLTDGTFLINQDASKQNFIAKISDFDIIHISTHAESNKTPYIKCYDSIMNLNEIYGLSLKADLVVLSACKTGLGRIQRGEGALSLARGFKYAGAKSIIQSLWQVNDKATALLMRNFYQNLNANSKSNALYEAKLNYLHDNTIKNLKKSPYYWAAFQYYGNNENINFAKPNIFMTNQKYIFALISIILVISFISYKKKA